MSELRLGLPVDPAQWGLFALGLSILVVALRAPSPARDRGPLCVAAAAAALLSAAYIGAYLRGGPRIIDATSYFLEARALSEGIVAWVPEGPLASVSGRFLVQSSTATGDAVAVIFPPGYPAVLAMGFAIGAPLAVGPVLAGLLVFATYDLARVACADADPMLGRLATAVAVTWSVLCGALRYHTADTMSHGLAALCFTLALSFGLRASQTPSLRTALATGGAIGLLFATRPVSAMACAACLIALLALRRPAGVLRWGGVAVAAGLPFAAAFAWHQAVASGSPWGSSQLAYYAQADGPAGCFRFGFGEGIGCLYEHGDFVRHNLADGYGAYEALATTARRLKMHWVDVGNAEPLFLLVPLAGIAAARPAVRWLLVAVAAQMVAYAPFYFDGNYPGGGGRFFADVLPIEHVLAGVAVGEIVRRIRHGRGLPPGRLRLIVGLVVALPAFGFAFRGGFDHAALRDREGGRPMFEASTLERTGVRRGVVLVDTDHGFNLGHRPSARATEGIEVLRRHGDDIDVFVASRRGAPAYRYRYDFDTGASSVEPLELRAAGIVEAESLWPARLQRVGYAAPEHEPAACGSGDRRLGLYPDERGATDVELLLPEELSGSDLAPVVWTPVTGRAWVTVSSADGAAVAWEVAASDPPTCVELERRSLPITPRPLVLRLRSESSSAWAVDVLRYPPASLTRRGNERDL